MKQALLLALYVDRLAVALIAPCEVGTRCILKKIGNSGSVRLSEVTQLEGQQKESSRTAMLFHIPQNYQEGDPSSSLWRPLQQGNSSDRVLQNLVWLHLCRTQRFREIRKLLYSQGRLNWMALYQNSWKNTNQQFILFRVLMFSQHPIFPGKWRP